MLNSAPLPALEKFSAQIPRGARILCTNEDAGAWLTERGFEIQNLPPDKDLRLLSLRRESFAGIWAGSGLTRHPTRPIIPIEDAQRVIATFFQALVPGKGMLFAVHPYPAGAFASLLRQNGLEILSQGIYDQKTAVLCRRI